jgi:hypothetical protein
MFLTNPLYQKMLVNHQTICAELENISFVNLATHEPITKEDLLIRRTDNRKEFAAYLSAFSKKMHENTSNGTNVILSTLKEKIKKEDSKKEDALGFPENMNYGDRSMMRQELIRIIRASYLV